MNFGLVGDFVRTAAKLCVMVTGILTAGGFGSGCQNREAEKSALPRSVELFRSLWEDSAGLDPTRSAIIFLADFKDFGCPPCLESFLESTGTLSEAASTNGKTAAILVFKRNEEDYAVQRRKMSAWCRGRGIQFPFFLLHAKYLAEDAWRGSRSVVVDPGGEIVINETFPISEQTQTVLIRMLEHDATSHTR